MAQLVHVWLFGWIVLVVVVFPRLPPHRAVIAAFVAGLLFLPVVLDGTAAKGRPTPIVLPGLHFTKQNVITYAILLAVLVHDRARLLAFRPRWFDVPMLVWCVCPLLSSLTNPPPPDGSTPLKDGVSQALLQTWSWGIPYVLGRVYLADLRRLRDLGLGMVLGGLAYVPLCWYEIRMSPQLHGLIYGYAQHEFGQTMRWGGYRPTVFMEHGLAVGMWMVTATLVALWLWWTGAVSRLEPRGGKWALSMGGLALLLLATAVMVKSTGSLALGLVGLTAIFLSGWWRTPLPVACLLAVAPLYVGGRVSGVVTGQALVEWVGTNVSADRAGSLEFRLDNENLLMDRAFERPVFGWGGWGRNRVTDEEDRDITVTDGLWIITLGDRGMVGLLALYLAMLLPPARFLWLRSRGAWSRRAFAPAAAIAVALILYMIDNLFNDHFNQAFVLAAGGLAALDGSSGIPPASPAPAVGRGLSSQSPAVPSGPSAPRPGVLRRPLP